MLPKRATRSQICLQNLNVDTLGLSGSDFSRKRTIPVDLTTEYGAALPTKQICKSNPEISKMKQTRVVPKPRNEKRQTTDDDDEREIQLPLPQQRPQKSLGNKKGTKSKTLMSNSDEEVEKLITADDSTFLSHIVGKLRQDNHNKIDVISGDRSKAKPAGVHELEAEEDEENNRISESLALRHESGKRSKTGEKKNRRPRKQKPSEREHFGEIVSELPLGLSACTETRKLGNSSQTEIESSLRTLDRTQCSRKGQTRRVKKEPAPSTGSTASLPFTLPVSRPLPLPLPLPLTAPSSISTPVPAFSSTAGVGAHATVTARSDPALIIDAPVYPYPHHSSERSPPPDQDIPCTWNSIQALHQQKKKAYRSLQMEIERMDPILENTSTQFKAPKTSFNSRELAFHADAVNTLEPKLGMEEEEKPEKHVHPESQPRAESIEKNRRVDARPEENGAIRKRDAEFKHTGPSAEEIVLPDRDREFKNGMVESLTSTTPCGMILSELQQSEGPERNQDPPPKSRINPFLDECSEHKHEHEHEPEQRSRKMTPPTDHIQMHVSRKDDRNLQESAESAPEKQSRAEGRLTHSIVSETEEKTLYQSDCRLDSKGNTITFATEKQIAPKEDEHGYYQSRNSDFQCTNFEKDLIGMLKEMQREASAKVSSPKSHSSSGTGIQKVEANNSDSLQRRTLLSQNTEHLQLAQNPRGLIAPSPHMTRNGNGNQEHPIALPVKIGGCPVASKSENLSTAVASPADFSESMQALRGGGFLSETTHLRTSEDIDPQSIDLLFTERHESLAFPESESDISLGSTAHPALVDTPGSSVKKAVFLDGIKPLFEVQLQRIRTNHIHPILQSSWKYLIHIWDSLVTENLIQKNRHFNLIHFRQNLNKNLAEHVMKLREIQLRIRDHLPQLFSMLHNANPAQIRTRLQNIDTRVGVREFEDKELYHQKLDLALQSLGPKGINAPLANVLNQVEVASVQIQSLRKKMSQDIQSYNVWIRDFHCGAENLIPPEEEETYISQILQNPEQRLTELGFDWTRGGDRSYPPEEEKKIFSVIRRIEKRLQLLYSVTLWTRIAPAGPNFLPFICQPESLSWIPMKLSKESENRDSECSLSGKGIAQ